MIRPAAAPRQARREMRSDAARNKEVLVRAATAAFHRDGLSTPMAAIAAEAGVGVATLYRHFPDRDALLAELTHRSFEQVLENAKAAERGGTTPIESLRHFIGAAMKGRNDLVLPLHGGPAVTSNATRRIRTEIHRTIQRILDLGVADRSIRQQVRALDIVTFGALLSQPTDASADWNATCDRLLDSFLRGLAPDPGFESPALTTKKASSADPARWSLSGPVESS